MKASHRFILRSGLIGAIGIALPLTMYATLRAVVFAALPWPAAGRTVLIFSQSDRKPDQRLGLSGPEVERLRSRLSAVEALSGFAVISGRPIRYGDVFEPATAVYLSNDWLPELGGQLNQGRWFTPDECRYGGPGAVVVSEAFWRGRLAGRPDVVGMVLHAPTPVTIVGVTAASRFFQLLYKQEPDLFFPAGAVSDSHREGLAFFEVAGSLRTGSSFRELQAQIDVVPPDKPRNSTPPEARRIRALLASDAILGSAGGVLWGLFVGTGVVWGMALVNTTALVVARVMERRTELAIRWALGATQWQLMVAVAREVVCAAALSAALALAGAWAGARFLASHAAWFGIARLEGVRLDWTALLWAVAAAAVLAAAATIGAALSWRHRGLAGIIPGGIGHRSSVSPHRGTSLVVVQFAFALVVANLAASTGRSLLQAMTRSLGFNAEHVIAVRLRFPSLASTDLSGIASQSQIRQSLFDFAAGLPGVRGVTGAFPGPTTKDFVRDFRLSPDARGPRVTAIARSVAPSYFSVMGIPLIAGASFRPGEGRESSNVLVNAAFARAYVPQHSAVGDSIFAAVRGRPQTYRIIGIVGDTVESPLDPAATPVVYFPGFMNMTDLLIRSDRPAGIVSAVQRFIRAADPNVFVVGSQTLSEDLMGPLATSKAQFFLSSIFALAALALAAAGLYGLIRHSEEQRAHADAIRLAIGATNFDILLERTTHTLRMAATGIAVGVGAAIATGGVTRALLYRVSGTDFAAIASAAGLLALVALATSWATSSNVWRIQPCELLRPER